MTKQPQDLELIVLDLIHVRLERKEQLFVFSSGALRGKLQEATYRECIPSSTFIAGRASYDTKPEPCLSLTYIPGPRDSGRVKDLDFDFTRKPVTFNIPVECVPNCVFLQKIEDGVWMLNINTKAK